MNSVALKVGGEVAVVRDVDDGAMVLVEGVFELFDAGEISDSFSKLVVLKLRCFIES